MRRGARSTPPGQAPPARGQCSSARRPPPRRVPISAEAHVLPLARVDPETEAFNAALERRLALEQPLHTILPDAVAAARRLREARGEPRIASPLAEERTIATPGGPLGLRVFTPPEVRGCYLHLHGGGWVFGSAWAQDGLLEELARTCRIAVVSVDYRLAPEHPYPAGPDDCEAAALWLVEHCLAELGTDALCIGGESAGAQLAVVTLLRLRDRHDLAPFVAASLASGFFDLGLTPSARVWGNRRLGLTSDELEWLAGRFVNPSRRREPDVSPLYAELEGLPDALFLVGTLDPLLDDTLLLSSRWAAAGNHAEAVVLSGGVNSVYDSAPPLASAARTRASAFLGERLDEV
ncbi:MAG: alpha/beta hydrolase fold domain-containing protein [Gaiellaceae bacterium]